MSIIYGVPVYKRYDLLARNLASVRAGNLQPCTVAIVNNGAVELTPQHLNERVFRCTTRQNAGVAGAWNHIFSLGKRPDDIFIISNDDVVVGENTLREYVEAVQGSVGRIALSHGFGVGNGFSLYAMTYATFDLVGIFDEAYWPAYFEDNNYATRLERAGGQIVYVTVTGGDHEGSATLKSYTPEEQEVHHQQFRRNREVFNAFLNDPNYKPVSHGYEFKEVLMHKRMEYSHES